MHDTDHQVLEAARGWSARGHRFALVTVAKTWGSAPRPAGSSMALRDDGQVRGSVSGGCIETDLIERAKRGWAGGTVHRQPHAAGNRGGHPGADDRGTQRHGASAQV